MPDQVRCLPAIPLVEWTPARRARRTGQPPLVKPYVRISRIRRPSTFTAQTLHRLGGAPPGGPTAPARAG
ncbi:MAG TPA: hypothetical protein VFO14_00600, partial [Vicinamibacterales bacterium]|nr:hypothetical protein [Vicinamibacterales bacterium]